MVALLLFRHEYEYELLDMVHGYEMLNSNGIQSYDKMNLLVINKY